MLNRFIHRSVSGAGILLTLLSTGVQADPVKLNQEMQTFSVKTGATRLIYSQGSSGATLSVINPQTYPMLVQSSVLKSDKKTKAPFIVTPPLFRLDGGQSNRLSIIATGDTGPSDRESLDWVCLTGIPPEPDSAWAQRSGKSAPKNTATIETQLRITSCIKLFVRPPSLKGDSSERAGELIWRKTGSVLKINNPTPFYMNLASVKIGASSLSYPGYVPPMGALTLKVPSVATTNVHFSLITDYGGNSREFSATLSQ